MHLYQALWEGCFPVHLSLAWVGSLLTKMEPVSHGLRLLLTYLLVCPLDHSASDMLTSLVFLKTYQENALVLGICICCCLYFEYCLQIPQGFTLIFFRLRFKCHRIKTLAIQLKNSTSLCHINLFYFTLLCFSFYHLFLPHFVYSFVSFLSPWTRRWELKLGLVHYCIPSV